MISWLLKLSCACLSFDFIGTSTDESADDLVTVQIPTSWRSIFLDNLTLQLYFDLFHNLSSELAAMVRFICLCVCVCVHACSCDSVCMCMCMRVLV